MHGRLNEAFFHRDVLEVAPALLGKTLVRKLPDGSKDTYIITETEAYRGPEDRACHAAKGRTSRTEVMFWDGGKIYVYLIYGLYWLLNIVTGAAEQPQAALIRGVQGIEGPGRVGRALLLDKTFYGEDLTGSDRIWLEQGMVARDPLALPRVGIRYAGEPWVSIPWRFRLEQ